MHFVRSAAVFLLTTLLPTLLVATVLTATIWNILGSRDRFKDRIDESGAYETYLPIFDVQEQEGQVSDATIPLDEDVRREISQKALTPELRQTQIESFIDGTYDWLEGKTPKPTFTLEFSAIKTNLATALADYGAERFAGLPVCPGTSATTDINAFEATCRPPNITAEMAAEQIRREFVSSQDFIEDTSLSANEIGRDEQGMSVFDRLSELPKIYSLLQLSQILLPLLTAVILVSIILISTDRKKSMRRLGFTLLVIGGLMIVGSFYSKSALDWFRNTVAGDQADALGEALIGVIFDILRVVTVSAGKIARYYGIGYAVIGAALLTAGIVLGKRDSGSAPPSHHGSPASKETRDEHPATEPEAPEDKPAPPPRPRPPRLIQ